MVVIKVMEVLTYKVMLKGKFWRIEPCNDMLWMIETHKNRLQSKQTHRDRL
jgi:hypothetical protein